MLNYDIMARWQNWFIVTLMFLIAAVGLHSFIDVIDKD